MPHYLSEHLRGDVLAELAVRKIALCLALLSFHYSGGVTSADAPKEVKPAVSKEKELLSSCVPIACPVFYISALGRSFPIPTRYRMLTRSRSDNLFTKFSSPIPEFASLSGTLAGDDLTGLITVGPIEELRDSEKLGKLVLTRSRRVGDIDIYSISLVAEQGSDRRLLPTNSVVLIGVSDYIQVSDENRLLPDLLIGISQRLIKSID